MIRVALGRPIEIAAQETRTLPPENAGNAVRSPACCLRASPRSAPVPVPLEIAVSGGWPSQNSAHAQTGS